MKKLTTQAGVFGPYQVVETLEERYRCDGADLAFSVVGYGEITEWVGSLPIPPAPPVVVPEQVTMRQARLALLGAGFLSSVNAAIESLPEPQKTAAKIEWEYSAAIDRHRPLVQMLGPVLGLDSNALDALFVEAAKL